MKKWLVYGQMPYRGAVQQLRHPPLQWPPDVKNEESGRAAHEFNQKQPKSFVEHRRSVMNQVGLAFHLPDVSPMISHTEEVMNTFAGRPYGPALEMRSFAQRYTRPVNPTAVPRVPPIALEA